MSRQYDHYERTTRRSNIAGPRRNGLGHWIPLALTVTAAVVGIAAWVWSERSDDDDEEEEENEVPRKPSNDSVYTRPPNYKGLRDGEAAYGTVRSTEEPSYLTRMSGALRRTPSPQQVIDGASRTIGAGVAAAGAAVGNALSSIREEDKNAYRDHKTWSEEVDSRVSGGVSRSAAEQGSSAAVSRARRGSGPQGGSRRKTVAVVVSADTSFDGTDNDEDYHHEHASILSHLPTNIDFYHVRLFVLVYCPGLHEHPFDTSASRPAGSLSSSFSNIGHDQALPPGEEFDKALIPTSLPTTSAFNAIWSQAQPLVEKETMILPFTSKTGHLHILRQLAPDYVYLQESLAGQNGDVVTTLQRWLRQDVVLVVGADGGHGGLADSESDAEHVEKTEHWWEREDRVGRGRGVVVVEGLRVGDDWARRIEGKE
ncbi:MAG: hypothetical protein M1818_007527 [Claussenomyces sp. TS43310]|nr:MAG: hypothetical protein M1818_007527 [Claussenomyces sp. TS43310]